MINVFLWDTATNTARWTDEAGLPSREHLPAVVWVDLENPSPEEEKRIFEEFFRVHPLTLEDVQRPRRLPADPPHFPKAEEFRDYLFVIVNPLADECVDLLLERSPREEDLRLHTQLSIILTPQVLITHHYKPLTSIAQLRSYLGKHEAQAARGPDFLCHLILDVMVDRYAPVLDRVDDSLDQIENDVFSRPGRHLLERLLGLKRNIILLRKTMIYEREVLARLSRGEFALIEDRERVYYRNVYDHLIRFTELIEASREMVMDLMQTHVAAASNKLNEIMKVLAMISTTILPMSLIAGIYGMNFENNVWPDFKQSPWGFVIALAMMALSGLGAFGFFRWMRWI
jgi:magnesium transporter